MPKRSFILILTLFRSDAGARVLRLLRRQGRHEDFQPRLAVVVVRDQDRTVMTMANDFQGSARDFAVVIPVPTKIERGQIHVREKL